MMDLMREMNGNLEDKLNNRQSRVFSLQARVLQVYPGLSEHAEYFYTNPAMLENSYVDKCDNPEVLIEMVNENVRQSSVNMSMTK